MNPTCKECPYGLADCPKVKDIEDRMDKMESHIENQTNLLWGVLGGVVTTLVATLAGMVV